jgi:xylulokinase
MMLSVDLGTTNCKVLALDPECRIVHSDRQEYPILTPRPGWAEQEPESWWSAVSQGIRRVAGLAGKANIQAIGLSGQMHGLVALDERKRVLGPAILWNDQRAEPECREIYAAVGGAEALAALTGNAMLPGYLGGKLLWLKKHQPEVFARVHTVLLPKDFLRLRLCGECATDRSDASGTGLFDVRAGGWARPLLERLDISGDLLPPCLGAWEVAGRLLPGVADELGLAAGIPVVAGGGDAVMQTVGAGVTDEDVLVVIGTGGNVTMTSRSCPPLPAPNAQVFCHVLPERWVAMGVTLNAGNALRWYRDLIAGRASAAGGAPLGYEALTRLAESSSPGARGLVFLPYLQGERCPHADASARGCLIGLTLQTREADVVRSVMEGVTLSLLDVFQALRGGAGSGGRVVASGGGAASAGWRQMLADVFDRPVVTREAAEDASALGAAIVAGLALRVWSTAEEAVEQVRVTSTVEPDRARASRYRELYPVYRSLYPELKRSFEALAGFA